VKGKLTPVPGVVFVNNQTGIIKSLAAILPLLLDLPAAALTASDWQPLAPGLDLSYVTAAEPSSVGDSRITVVRLDPAEWALTVASVCQPGEGGRRTARQWAQDRGLTIAINAGMFAEDHRTHVGYLRHKDHVNNNHVNSYQSVAAFDPRPGRAVPAFRIFDLDEPGVTMTAILDDYASALQNLRLIKRPGENRWHSRDKIWSEAALGEDSVGRILMVFSRSPFAMPDLNRELLAAGIDLVALQHLEGGPEAQLYLRLGDLELELCGSYETGFLENDDNLHAWPLPFVLGARPRR
jgi:hypothetical protein